jgi:hypothetical protein
MREGDNLFLDESYTEFPMCSGTCHKVCVALGCYTLAQTMHSAFGLGLGQAEQKNKLFSLYMHIVSVTYIFYSFIIKLTLVQFPLSTTSFSRHLSSHIDYVKI